MTKRNIIFEIFKLIISCGLYSFYQIACMTDEINEINSEKDWTGGFEILLIVLSFGLYAIYWNYRMGKKIYRASIKYHKNIKDKSWIYLCLALIGFGIVNYFLIIDDLNKFIELKNNN